MLKMNMEFAMALCMCLCVSSRDHIPLPLKQSWRTSWHNENPQMKTDPLWNELFAQTLQPEKKLGGIFYWFFFFFVLFYYVCNHFI